MKLQKNEGNKRERERERERGAAMAVSWSGTLMLLLLLFAGPLVYLLSFLWTTCVRKKKQKKKEEEEEKHLENTAESSAAESHCLEHQVEAGHGDEEREQWSSMQYLFGLIGYAIGIGNVWRFCYVIAQDGGAASLLAYMISFVFIATPLFMYEMILGQFVRLSALPAWKFVHPRWAGLGYSQFLMTFIVQSYFVMVIAYTLPYIFGSCVEPLPWIENSEDHWYSTILGQNGKHGESFIQWHLLVSYIAVWVIIFLSISFGKEILSKVTYVTVIAPVVLILILVIRTSTLPGAGNGIKFYIGKFEGKKLLDLNVWARALSQCLFSLSPGFGTAVTMSSYTRPKEDVYFAAILVSCANTLFAVVAGFAIFSVVGNIAYTEGEEVAEVASRGGQGLAFIVIASAMPTFKQAGNAMSVMFFFMLFTLGLDSAFAWSETLTATVEDVMKERGFKKKPSWLVSLVVCTLNMLIGIPYSTTQGNRILDVVDNYVGINFLLYLCFLESIVFIFDFGYQRLERALKKATDGKRSLWPKYQCYFDFYFAIPVFCLGLFIYQIYYNITDGYLPDYPRIEIAGWVLLAACLLLTGFGMWRCGGEGKLAQQSARAHETGTMTRSRSSSSSNDDIELIARNESHRELTQEG